MNSTTNFKIFSKSRTLLTVIFLLCHYPIIHVTASSLENEFSNQNSTSSNNFTEHHHESNESEEEPPPRYEIASVNWARVATPYIISLWIVVAGIVKISFQLIHKYVSRVPESCVLICLGLIVGGIAYSIDKDHRIEQLLFNPDTFFLFILPPIVMEAGYFMPKEPFFENLGTILTYAIIGTIFNALAIGASLYGVYRAGFMPGLEEVGGLNVLHCLLFGSIISAVDPVAVISVFEEIHVNTVLYICVFGESLLNDGVAVVLFKMFEGYIEIGQEHILPIDIVNGIFSFVVVAIGALGIGLSFGYLGAFVTKYTESNRIIEPTIVFSFCYLAYLSAEVFHLSGIIAIVFAAFTMSSYVDQNLSPKSHTTVKYGMKMLANIAETIIFMLLGIAAVSDFWQYWNTGFVLWTLFFITVFRAIGVYSLTAMVNYVRLEKINKVDQFVMAYGGLRGAIAFSLVSLTSADHVPAIKTMICACIVAILFTSFIQGSTIRPIVELLKVKTANEHSKTMFEDINLRIIDHLMAGIEDVTGHHGHHYWMQRLHEINVKYIAKLFIRSPYKTRNEELWDTFHRINKRDAEVLVEEFEKGLASTGDLRQTPTFTNLLIPLELRKNYSQASLNYIMREHSMGEACIDMNALNINKHKDSIKTAEEADVHHLLQQNLYKPRRRERGRYRRGVIDEDSAMKKQEEEILIRHKIHFQHSRKHYKHKGKRKGRNSSKSPLAASSSSRNLKPNISAPTFRSPSCPIKKVKKQEEDVGITFTASPTTKTFPTPPDPDDNEVQLDSVAIDRELPWKQSCGAAVCDPHNDGSYIASRALEPEPTTDVPNGMELWPTHHTSEEQRDSNNIKETENL